MEVEKWRRRRRNSAKENTCVAEKKKSEEKRRVWNKIEAPGRFWTPNRRGACPEILKKLLLTHHVGYKAHNRRGVCPNFNFFSSFPQFVIQHSPRRLWTRSRRSGQQSHVGVSLLTDVGFTCLLKLLKIWIRLFVPTDVGLFIYLQKYHHVFNYIICLFNRHKRRR